MVEAYRKRFKAIEPFAEDGLLTLAGVSRGIFRRFLRYITLTLRRWEADRKGSIDTRIVKEAVTVERLAEDMELELTELFPSQRLVARLGRVAFLMVVPGSEVPDFAVGLSHVACVLVYDLVESTVVDRAHNIVVVCYVDDGWFVIVVPFMFSR